MLLTQSTMPIIGWIATLLGYVMDFIFKGLSAVGIQNVGLCIIIFTFFVRLIMIPLTVRQQKFMKINQAMQPEIMKIQKKYRNKKDQLYRDRMKRFRLFMKNMVPARQADVCRWWYSFLFSWHYSRLSEIFRPIFHM